MKTTTKETRTPVKIEAAFKINTKKKEISRRPRMKLYGMQYHERRVMKEGTKKKEEYHE